MAPTGVHDQIADLGRVLGVWAHPDDEAYLSAGVMALVAEAGGHITCVTATRGERGTPDPQNCTPERLATLRERELAESLAILGVADHRWLEHADGECHTVPEAEGAAQVASIIAEVRPDTVITFGPDGMTGHADHIAVGRWATAASRAAVHRPRVLHAAVDDALFAEMGHELDQFEIYGPEGPPRATLAGAALRLGLPEQTLDQKFAALSAQASQTDSLIADMGPDRYRRWLSIEAFVEAW